MNEDYLFSDIVSNSSVQKNEISRNHYALNLKDSEHFNIKKLVYFNKTIRLTSNRKCIFQHLTKEEFQKFLNSTFNQRVSMEQFTLVSNIQNVILQLTKVVNHCIFMASKEVLNISDAKANSKYSYNPSICNGFESIKSQISFIRNICEKVTILLNQPWILQSKIAKSNLFGSIKGNIHKLLKLFLPKFILHINTILFTSNFIVFTGLRSLSFSNFRNYNNSELWNFARGVEEYNKMFDHIKSINQSSLFRSTIDSREQFLIYLNKKIDSVCFVKTISLRNVFKILSNLRSTIMAERIHRFLYSSKDVFKAIRHRYLMIILHQQSFISNGLTSRCEKFDENSIEFDNISNYTSRSLVDDISSCDESNHNKQKKYRKFVQRLSNKMKHSTITEEVNMEYEFIICLLENVSRSTDLMKKLDESLNKNSLDIPSHFCNNLISKQNNKKNVQWRDNHDTTIQKQMSEYYLDRYWYQVDTNLDFIDCILSGSDSVQYDNHKKHISLSKLGSPLIHNPEIKIALSNLIKEPLLIKNFPQELKPCLYNQSLKLQLSARMSICESSLCKALGYSYDDRFFPEQKFSNTCSQFIKVLKNLKLELEDLNFEENIIHFLPMIQRCCSFSHLTINAIINRSRLKSQKILSSWSVSSFIFLIFADTKILLNKIFEIFNIVKTMTELKKSESIRNSLKKDLNVIKKDYEELEKIYSDMISALKNKIRNETLNCIDGCFPEANSWQRKQALNETNNENLTVKQYLPNEYVKSILRYNLCPIGSSLSCLEPQTEMKAIGIVIEIVLSTLFSYVLERKIKLSFVGACQLEADIKHIKEWMEKYLSVDVFVYVSNLSILKDIQKIFEILKRQHTFDFQNRKQKDHKGFKICSNLKAVKVLDNNIPLHSKNNLPDQLSDGELNGSFSNFNVWSKLRAHPIDSNIVTFHSCM